MKVAAVLKYTANDGSVFKDEHACLEHEAKTEAVAKIMEPLGSVPNELGFSNGHNWIQHDRRDVERVKVKLCKYLQQFMQHKWIDQTIAEPSKVDSSWVGRLLSDSSEVVLYAAWSRIMCIDEKTGREYGQPYFVMHPKEVDGNALKPIRKKKYAVLKWAESVYTTNKE